MFTILLPFYVAGILIHYGRAKLKSHRVTRILDSVELATPNVYKMTFMSIDNKSLNYQAGQYIFLRFVSSALPKESHPFSIVSAPHTAETSFVVMAKESGDYTRKLNLLKPGDKASIEGPYGDFWSDSAAAKENHPPYSYGQINAEYLSKIGIQALYANADFLICGPRE